MPVVGAGGCGDPNVAYDRNGTAYILGIGNCNGSTGSIVFQTSTNNGVTWSAAKTAFGSLLGGLTDKEWTEVDTNPASPFLNCVYVSWTDFNSSFTQTRASVAHSCDGGNTWTRVAADTTRTVPQIDQFTDLAIGDDGTVYLTWMYCKLWVGYYHYSGGKANANLISSVDDGATWSAPVQITSVGNQGWLWLANNDVGRTSLSFLHSSTNGTYTSAAVVTMTGTSFLKAKLSSVPPMSFSNDGFGGTFIGDYIGGIWTGNTLHSSWMDTRSGGVSSDMTGGLST